jgi:hypothetical protein
MQEKNQYFSTIKRNILNYADYKGISKYEIYQKTGISRSVLSQNNGMTEDNLLKFLSYYTDVNPEWLLTGKGAMLRDNSSVAIADNGSIASIGNNNNIDNRRYYSDSPDVLKAQIDDKDKLLREKDERLREKDAYILELKETITELKEKTSEFQHIRIAAEPEVSYNKIGKKIPNNRTE